MPREKREEWEVQLARAIREGLRDRYLKGPNAISQRQLAERLGRSFQTVNAWFRDPPAIPDVATLATLARTDGWNLNDLLLGDAPRLRRSVVGHHFDEEKLIQDWARREVQDYLLWRQRRAAEAFTRLEADIVAKRLVVKRFRPKTTRRRARP